MKTSFYCFQKIGFWKENIKNKNTPLSLNMFLVFFVFKNIKEFLKTTMKEALNFKFGVFDDTFNQITLYLRKWKQM